MWLFCVSLEAVYFKGTSPIVVNNDAGLFWEFGLCTWLEAGEKKSINGVRLKMSWSIRLLKSWYVICLVLILVFPT